MAPPIADQVHRRLKWREEQRCNELERATGKKAKRKKIPLPVVRMGPEALCQNLDYLILVSEYDYDLSDPKFQDYCSSRGTLHLAGVRGSTRWQYFAAYSLSKDEYLANPYFQFAQEIEGTRHKFTPEDIEVQWKIILLARATLQDCWELYKQKGRGSDDQTEQPPRPPAPERAVAGPTRTVVPA
jgi:hypothetical protein